MTPTPPCPTCLDLSPSKIQAASRITNGYAPTLPTLSRSATSCPVCAMLVRAAHHFYPEVWPAASLYRAYFFLFKEGIDPRGYRGFALSVSPNEFPETEEDPLEGVVDGWRKRLLHVFSVPGKPCPWEVVEPGVVPCHDLDGLAVQVKSWMAECEASHDECRPLHPGVLPKRVVQILPGSQPGHCKVRLHETSASQRGQYICLSHCWGKHQIIVTNKTNLTQHQTEIPWDALSTTFKDALDFSRRLGIEFVWIDSLCIVQDSTPDWEAEAVKMASYYSNADLTIAASAAKDGTIGLFPKKVATDEALELVGRVKAGRPYEVVVRTAIDHPFDVDGDEDDLFPLTKRGWVYQEHMLSRRFLHFGTREVVWECHASTRCQCSSRPEKPRPDRATNQVLSAAKSGGQIGDVKERRRLWYENVEAVMGLDFTYMTDRLAATAGVATLLGKGYEGRYLAGLWEDSLVADLCWVLIDNGERPDELEKVPSWSWASVTGDFAAMWCKRDLDGDDVKLCARVVEVECEPDPPSFIGLTRGVVTLEGEVVAATMKDEARHGSPQMDHFLIVGHGEEKETFGSGWFFHPDCKSFWREPKSTEVQLIKMMETLGGRQRIGVYLVLQGGTGPLRRIGLLTANVRRQQAVQAGSLLDRFDHLAQTTRVRIE